MNTSRIRNGRRRSIYLDDEQWAALAELGREYDRSTSSVIRRLVADELARRSEPKPDKKR